MISIIIDTREQLPFMFGRWNASVYFDTLETGDYSLHGYADDIAVERKSLSDFYLSIGRNYKRFVNQAMRRLADFRFKLLVVETELQRAIKPHKHPYTSLHPSQVWGTLSKLIVDYGIPVLFADTRSAAETATYKFLTRSHYTARKLHESSLIPYRFRKHAIKCGICGMGRQEVIAESPGLASRSWLRIAEYKRPDGRLVLGKRLMICHKCQALIRKKRATLPTGFRWARR